MKRTEIDDNIKYYNSRELILMLSKLRYPDHTFVPFTEKEIKEELRKRNIIIN